MALDANVAIAAAALITSAFRGTRLTALAGVWLRARGLWILACPSPAASAAARSGLRSGGWRSVSVMLFLRDGAEEPGRPRPA